MKIFQLGEKKPSISPLAYVAEGAILIGDVTLESNASVWFGAVIRADNAPVFVGKNSNIQDLCVIHCDADLPVVIGDNCTIGHRVTLHSCKIEQGALIGMGSTILNHAVIPAGCMVAANSLVSGGKTFPENSLIMGSPAKFVRLLTTQEQEELAKAASHYVDASKEYLEHLKELQPS